MDLRHRLLEELEPFLAAEFVELVDVRIQTHGRRRTICLLVDTPEGIAIDDCVRISRRVEDHLDTVDLIPFRYVLEVSSPGVDRPLRKSAHFERFAGERVEIRMIERFGPRRQFTGTLIGFADGAARVALDGGEEVALPLSEMRSARVRRDPWKPRGNRR